MNALGGGRTLRISGVGEDVLALAVAGLSRCHEAQDEVAKAVDGYQRVLAAGRAVGKPGLVATAWEGLARLAAADGDFAKAGELAAEAAVLRVSASRPAPPHERFQGWASGVPVTAG